MLTDDTTPPTSLRLSVVIPAHNECKNIGALIDEVVDALSAVGAFEIVVVDDASTDGTVDQVRAIQTRVPQLRLIRHARNCGQSAALMSGVRAARAAWIGTLDADGQNDPADLPLMLMHLEKRDDPDLKLIQGWRLGRRDPFAKRVASKIANAVRSSLLRDNTPDSGCGIRVVERRALLGVPAFDHMHRFIPALMSQRGWKVESFAVSHRPRMAGRSHYGLWDRLWVGIVDLVGVAWLGRRLLRGDDPNSREL